MRAGRQLAACGACTGVCSLELGRSLHRACNRNMCVVQVMGLQGVVQAHSLTSLSTKEEAAAVMNILTAAASKPKGKGTAAAGDPAGQQAMLLYCTPEKIVASKRLMSKLEKVYQVSSVA